MVDGWMSEVDGEMDGWMDGCMGEVAWVDIKGNGWVAI